MNRLADEGDTKSALAAARSLAKATARTNVRAAALQIILRTDVKKRTQNLLAALRDGDREYRGAALDFAGDFADEALYAAVVRKMPSLTEQARTDIVNWLGARHAASQTDAVVAMIGSDDDELAAAAIRAAGKIGGTKALEALIACLDGPHAAEASAALLAFNGNVNEGVLAALDGAPSTQVHALKLAAGSLPLRTRCSPCSHRRMPPCGPPQPTPWRVSRPSGISTASATCSTKPRERRCGRYRTV